MQVQDPHHVPCQYLRPGNPDKHHCLVEVLPPHKLEGLDVFLSIPGQEHFKYAQPGTIIMAKNKFTKKNEWLADASPAYIQEKEAQKYQHPSIGEPDFLKQLETPVQKSEAPVPKNKGGNMTYKIDQIELRNPENVEVFERCAAFYGSKKEAGRRLIAFAIACMKEAKEFDLPNAC